MRKRFFIKRVVTDHYTVVARTRDDAKQVVVGDPEPHHVNKQVVQWEITGWREEGPGDIK